MDRFTGSTETQLCGLIVPLLYVTLIAILSAVSQVSQLDSGTCCSTKRIPCRAQVGWTTSTLLCDNLCRDVYMSFLIGGNRAPGCFPAKALERVPRCSLRK